MGLLSKRILTFPNVLTSCRIIVSPIIGYFLLNNMYEPALALTAANGATDFFDGWYARKYKAQTQLGKFLDPLADKIFIFSTVAPLIRNGAIPSYLGGIILCRDLGLILGSMKYYRSLHFDASKFRPTILSKINTSLQIAYVLALITSGAFGVAKNYYTIETVEAMKILVSSTSICTTFQYWHIYRKFRINPL